MTSQFQITVPFTPEHVAALMVTVIEGGSAYWCRGVFLEHPDREVIKTTSVTQEYPWYAQPDLYTCSDFRLEVVEDEPSHQNHDGKWLVHPAQVQRGFDLMSQKHPDRVTSFLGGDVDADDADLWFQYVVFGEAIYG